MSTTTEALKAAQTALDGVRDAWGNIPGLMSPGGLKAQIDRAAELVSAALAQAEQPDPRDDCLRAIVKDCDAAKEQCGMDPESPAAIRNSKFASIAHMAAQGLGWVRGPAFEKAEPAEQAQPVAALLRSRRVTTWPHAAMDRQTHYSEWGEWLPTTYKHAKAVTDPSRNTDPRCYEMLPLYAAPPAAEPVAPKPVAWQAHYIDRDGNPAVYTTSNYALAVENDINGSPMPLAAPPAAPQPTEAPFPIRVLRDFLGSLPQDLGDTRRMELRDLLRRLVDEGGFAAPQPEPLRHKDIGRLWDQIDGPHLSSDQWAAMHRFCPLLLAAAAPQPQAAQQAVAPIDMILHCPACGMQHVDGPDDMRPNFYSKTWDNPPHRSHLCHGCGHIWRPSDVPTNGVAAINTKGQNDSPLAAAPTQAAQARDDAIWYDIRATLRAVIEDGHSADLDEVDAKRLLDLIDAAPTPAAPLTDADIEAVMGPCQGSAFAEHLRREFVKSFKRVYFKLHPERAHGIGAPQPQAGDGAIYAAVSERASPEWHAGFRAGLASQPQAAPQPTGPLDDFGRPIVYDTEAIDNVTHALTGDEGEDDSVTVLERLAAYVQNVWPGKPALQVLLEYEEKTLAAAPQPQAAQQGVTASDQLGGRVRSEGSDGR